MKPSANAGDETVIRCREYDPIQISGPGDEGQHPARMVARVVGTGDMTKLSTGL